jgi:hypothetical protein
MEIEEIARRWCSKENNNIKLTKERVVFWDTDKNMYQFEFDITSHPRRKEIEIINSKIKQYEEQHGKINNMIDNPYFKELVGMYCLSPGQFDNREIIGMVKSGKHDNGTNYESILGDCFLLTKAKADKKYMILTDKDMYDYFLGRCKGILDEITLIYLDIDKHKQLLENM